MWKNRTFQTNVGTKTSQAVHSLNAYSIPILCRDAGCFSPFGQKHEENSPGHSKLRCRPLMKALAITYLKRPLSYTDGPTTHYTEIAMATTSSCQITNRFRAIVQYQDVPYDEFEISVMQNLHASILLRIT